MKTREKNNFPYKKTVLVVDDSSFVLKIVQKHLENEGYNIITANNAFDALSTLESVLVDALLLDIMMPVVNGYSFLKIIKCRRQTVNIPVLVMSSLDTDSDIQKALEMGAACYIQKNRLAGHLKKQLTLVLANNHHHNQKMACY